MKNANIKRNNSLDAMMLAVVKIMTMAIGIVSSAILSRALSLSDYGTYVSGNLIVTTGATLTILGMMDAANYFYNLGGEHQRDYVNTVAALQIFIGLACALILLLGKRWIIRYFGNEALGGIYLLLVFRPMLTNLSNVLLILQTAVGRARAVAARNMAFSLLRLGAVLLTAFVFKRIDTIFIAFLLLDILTILYYYVGFSRAAFSIRLSGFRFKAVGPILRFSLPMGAYVLMTSIARDIDKYVIAAFDTTENLAIYSNCAALLPFDFVAAAFLTVSIPIMTRLVQQKQFQRGQNLLKAYLKIGYLSTVTLTMICMILSREVILLLYGGKYLPGIRVFLLYTLVDMFKFLGVTLVLSAYGRTKTLMGISFAAMVLNVIFSPICYRVLGFEGPAVATVALVLGADLMLLSKSAKLLDTRVSGLFDWKEVFSFLLELLLLGVLAWLLRSVLLAQGLPYYLVLILVGGGYCGAIFLLQFKNLKSAMKQVNKEKLTAAGLEEMEDTE